MLEVGWTIAFAAILVIFAVPTVRVIFKTQEAPAATDLQVDVVGHQWWWEFRYPGQEVVTANEAHIPVGQTVAFHLHGPDVIHSFWVPQLGGKRDVVPGRVNRITLTPEVPGEYIGQCAEYCGISHANMRFRVVVHAKGEWEKWVAAQKAPPVEPKDELAQKGKEIFSQSACMGCHTIAGLSAGILGPNLTHFGSRKTLGGAIMLNTPENLAKWIENPGAPEARGADAQSRHARRAVQGARRLPPEPEVGEPHGDTRGVHAGGVKTEAAYTGVWSWITTVDHKRIGILYGVTAFIFFLMGGIEALIMRAQLARPDSNLVSAQTFNELFTMHGTTMIFLAIMPLSAAFFNFMIPLQIGARDVAFPRLNALRTGSSCAAASSSTRASSSRPRRTGAGSATPPSPRGSSPPATASTSGCWGCRSSASRPCSPASTSSSPSSTCAPPA